MAGLMPSELSHHGASDDNFGKSSKKKQKEELGRWYMSTKEIEENSPSRKDGFDLKKETYLRKSYCTFLQDLGIRLIAWDIFLYCCCLAVDQTFIFFTISPFGSLANTTINTTQKAMGLCFYGFLRTVLTDLTFLHILV